MYAAPAIYNAKSDWAINMLKARVRKAGAHSHIGRRDPENREGVTVLRVGDDSESSACILTNLILPEQIAERPGQVR